MSVETVNISDEDAEDNQKLKRIFRDKVRSLLFQDRRIPLNYDRLVGMEK